MGLCVCFQGTASQLQEGRHRRSSYAVSIRSLATLEFQIYYYISHSPPSSKINKLYYFVGEQVMCDGFASDHRSPSPQETGANNPRNPSLIKSTFCGIREITKMENFFMMNIQLICLMFTRFNCNVFSFVTGKDDHNSNKSSMVTEIRNLKMIIGKQFIVPILGQMFNKTTAHCSAGFLGDTRTTFFEVSKMFWVLCCAIASDS